MQANRDEDGVGSPNVEAEVRRLAAIMFTDIVGYSSMSQSNESLALALLDEHRKLFRPILASHGGEEIKTIGDAFLVEFRSALEAVRCAIKMQQALSQRNLENTSVRQIQIRIGIHVGDIVRVDGDVYGDTVNLASRIESVSGPGEIAISSQVYQQVVNKITFPIEKLGEYKLKNIATPTLVYRIQPIIDHRKPVKETREIQSRFAVLPLVNIGQGEEYLADGLTEEFISAFSHLPALKVVARTTMMRYKGSTKSISEIGSELNASSILEGSVRKHGDRLRITVQLIETTSEECLWSENYDRGIEDILEVQHDVAEKTVEALKSRMGDKKALKLDTKRSTENAEAFLLFLKGRYHLAIHTQVEVKLALDLFEQAIRIDPYFAASHAMCAQCYMFLGFFGFIPPQEAFEKALPSIKLAIEIDNDLDIAHMLMGRLLQDKWNWLGAEAEFRRAIEISPNSAEAHYRYALLLNDMKRGTEALAQVKIAEELDPLSVAVNQIAGTVMYFVGEYQESIVRFQRALEIEPRAALAHINLGLAQFEEGKVEEGIAGVRKALELDPKNIMFRADLCYILCRSGRESEARDVLVQSEAQANTQHISPVAIAGMYACLGEKDRAIEWLDKGFVEHSPYLGSLRVERWFDNIRGDTKFEALLRKLGLND